MQDGVGTRERAFTNDTANLVLERARDLSSCHRRCEDEDIHEVLRPQLHHHQPVEAHAVLDDMIRSTSSTSPVAEGS